MLFTSYIFLFLFLPLIVLIAWLFRGEKRNIALVLFSLGFYGWWRLDFLLLFIGSTIFNYLAGKCVSAREGRSRQIVLVVAVTVNLLVLGWFKYANFGMENWNALLLLFGKAALPWQKMILPVGISFYTFQAISYLVDISR